MKARDGPDILRNRQFSGIFADFDAKKQ